MSTFHPVGRIARESPDQPRRPPSPLLDRPRRPYFPACRLRRWSSQNLPPLLLLYPLPAGLSLCAVRPVHNAAAAGAAAVGLALSYRLDVLPLHACAACSRCCTFWPALSASTVGRYISPCPVLEGLEAPQNAMNHQRIRQALAMLADQRAAGAASTPPIG